MIKSTTTPQDLVMSLGDNVRRLRIRKGWSQLYLASLMGVSHPRVSEIERGESNPTLDTIKAFADALDTSADKLLRASAKKTENSA